MPQPTNGLFETLVAASSMAASELKYSNAMIETIFTDYQPIHGEIGQTLNVNIPKVNEGDVSDIGSGQIEPSDTAHDTVGIILDCHPSTSFVIKSFDKVRTPQDLKRLYLKPRLEALLRKCNRYFANYINPTDFPTYSAITGGTDSFTRANMAKAWANLTGQGVPVEEAGNLAMITSPLAYSNMMADTSFYQESVVGVEASVAATQRATIAPQFNCRIRWDQQAPIASAKQTALFFHRYAIAMVTANCPPSEDPSVKETIVFPKPNLPVQIQMQYSLRDQGWLIHMHTILGKKVVRPDHGCYMVGA